MSMPPNPESFGGLPPGGLPPDGPPSNPAGNSLPPPPQFVRYRRRSIFPGLLLIIVGLLLFVARLHPGFNLGYVITRFWPVIIILWGVAKLIDRLAQPQGALNAPSSTGGEIALIVVLVTLVFLAAAGSWVGRRFPRGALDLAPFTQHASADKSIDIKTVQQPKSNFAVSTDNGSINVHAAADNSLLVTGATSATADTQQAAQDRLKAVDVVFDGPSGNYAIHPINTGSGVSVDLDVQLPRVASVTAHSQHGDVSVSDVQGAADVSTRNGDFNVHDIGSNVTAEIQNGDTHIRNVAGTVNLTGHGGGDVEVTDIQQAATLSGNIFGDVALRNIPKGVHFTSPRASVEVAALPGEMKLDTSDIVISDALGPIVINAGNEDVRLESVSGALELHAKRGDITVTFSAPPKEPINITDDSGDVTLNLPSQSTFTLAAESRSGDITDDFAANPAHDDDHSPHAIAATQGSGGPAIHLATNYGDIHIGNEH